eukprot:6355648-Prymnesium_polylepis.1
MQTMGVNGGAAAPAPAAEPSASSATTDAKMQGAEAAAQAAQAKPADDGKTKARDFSFLVTEDTQDSGPN